MDKALYGNYLCLVAWNKQQVQWEQIKETTGKLRNLSGCGFVQT